MQTIKTIVKKKQKFPSVPHTQNFTVDDLKQLVDFSLKLQRVLKFEPLDMTKCLNDLQERFFEESIEKLKDAVSITQSPHDEEVAKLRAEQKELLMQKSIQTLYADNLIHKLIERIGKEKLMNIIDEIDIFLKENGLC